MKWINIIDVRASASGKTRVYHVQTADHSQTIGIVQWYGPWRKYCFFPNGSTVFEQDCLRDIATFIETATKEHRDKALEAAR